MKTSRASIVTRLAALATMITATASATSLYWNNSNNTASSTLGLWATAANWATDAAGTVSASTPTSADDLFFNTTSLNSTPVTINISPSIAAQSMTFNDTGAVTVYGVNATNRYLDLGGGGITLASGSGAVGFGGSNKVITLRVTASQTWTNNSASTLNVQQAIYAAATGSGYTLTFKNTGTGATSFGNVINDGTGGAVLTLVVDSTGSGAVSMNGGNFSGGTTVKRGTLSIWNGNFGTGDVTLGDTSGNDNAQVLIGSPGTTMSQPNHFTVNANGGVMSIGIASGSIAPTPSFTGTFTLNQTLLIGSTGTNNTAPVITLSGDVSGAGGLTLTRINAGTRDASLILSGANTYHGDTTIARSGSAFTLADTGSMTFYIGANGVNNRISGAGGSATFDGTFNFDLSGASLVNGNSWTIVDVGTLNESFAGTFAVTGFTGNSGVWTNGSGFSFDTTTGILGYAAIPEPSTYALLAGAGLFGFAAIRRKIRVSRAV